jgi:hypothetical protein
VGATSEIKVDPRLSLVTLFVAGGEPVVAVWPL